MFKKLFSLFAALTLSVGLWAETVSYLYPVYNTDGVAASGIKEWKTGTADATEITNSSATLAAGWYVVKGNVETGTLVCQGEVHLIVYDGAKLTATGADNKPGIKVAGEGNSLTIYGYTNQSGQLIATGGEEAAGIGGGKGGDGSNITINGGIVTATGGKYAAGIGGGGGGTGSYITINGGTITAISNVHGAGIGGGSGVKGSYITINGGTVTAICDSNYGGAGIGGGIGGDGFNITILAGTVTATGGEGSAGIGGGDGGAHGFNITISGGTVEATGGKYAAGIGGGGDGSEITISGGTVTATGGDMAAGIGGGKWYDGFNITISGGTVTATGGDDVAGIGSGEEGDAASNIFVATSLVVKAGSSANPTDEIAKTRTATTDIASDLAGKQYVTVEKGSTPTALPETEDSRFKIQNSKFVKNGQLIIRKENKTFNALGAELK